MIVVEKIDAGGTGGNISALDRISGVLPKIRGRLQAGQFEGFINDTVEIAVGDHEEFHPVTAQGEPSSEQIFFKALDFDRSKIDNLHGQKFHFWAAMGSATVDISRSVSNYKIGDFDDQEILTARDDVRNGLKIAVCMYDALSWMYGEGAFGLRMTSGY